VWRPRQAAMKQALGRIKAPQLRNLLLDAGRVDRAIKRTAVGPMARDRSFASAFLRPPVGTAQNRMTQIT